MSNAAVAHVNAIGRSRPPHEVHDAFLAFAETTLSAPRDRALIRRMAARSGIGARYSTLAPAEPGGSAVDVEGFYARGRFPGTGARMRRYAEAAPALAEAAVRDLGPDLDPAGVTHLVLASCTGFCAPGVDQRLVARLGLDPDIERIVLGFMGCAAAVNGLKTARHIVRSDPRARVLVVCVELCTLHLQEADDLSMLLSAMLFGDGAAAALVSAEPTGFALDRFRAVTIPGTADRITWDVADTGFLMHLSGAVPAAIESALAAERHRNHADGVLGGMPVEEIALFAVHPGGRTVLDAVETGLALDDDALAPSRAVLREGGNMSSPSILFVLADMLDSPGRPGEAGIGMAFGPGMVAETFRFARAAA
ncbi:type III polyketide synthase [Salinarimonas ramus]|uniref:Naringenin-chalcone synthase n=1 Tax=Salinarimonas ramus TaxID=690164 RepID=A0A917Q727_9HYPH|nr:type III polyketide synthase [Salinarimonas ramus]GGK32900.1 naringenin-chalcone synthase [Salinarimonas ramus]